MKNKRKVTTAIVAGVTAVALLLGGTFAWQSINQTALNEASDVINPGGRLHDDFDGTNKDIYVENFADEDIFARIQLSEYFAIIANYGNADAQKKTDIAGTATLTDGKITAPNYVIHYFGEDASNATDAYWNWTTGGSTVYMPTFNLNKDSLVADINGTYVDAIGGISNRNDPNRAQYENYRAWTEGDTKTDTEIYDGDTDMEDEVKSDFENLANYTDSIVTVADKIHTAKNTGNGTLISMEAWLAMVDAAGSYDAATHGNYWVYDTDGWVYWSAPIAGRNEDGTTNATGLLLDGIQLNGVMDDTWYYAINVVAQFVTADDVGIADDTGFYDTTAGTVPSADAENLLGLIGVDMDGEAEPEPAAVYAITAANADPDGFYGGYFADNTTYNLTMTKDGEALENVTWSMELVEGGTADSNNTLEDGTAINSVTGVVTVAADETTYNTYYTTYHVVEVTATAEDGATAGEYFIICNYGVSASPRVVNVDGSVVTDGIVVGETYKLDLNPYECGTNQRVGQYIDVSLNSSNTTILKDGEATDAVILNEDGTFVASESGYYQYEFRTGYFSGSNGFTVDEASGESGSTTQLTISIVETDYDGALTKGDTESITLKVDGNYSADDIEWTVQNTGVAFSYEMTTNEDGTITLSHMSSGICGANGQTFIATLKSDPSVTGSIDIVCDC